MKYKILYKDDYEEGFIKKIPDYINDRPCYWLFYKIQSPLIFSLKDARFYIMKYGSDIKKAHSLLKISFKIISI